MFDTVKALLAGLDIAVFDTDATETTVDHYVLVMFPGLSRSREESIACGGQVDLIVRSVGVTPEHARRIQQATRERLRGAHTGEWAFHWDGSPRPLQVERNVRIAGTNTALAWVDDEYTVFADKKE